MRGVNNNWSQIASTNSTQYIDSIILCNQLVSYRIEATDTNNNVSFSSIGSDSISISLQVDSVKAVAIAADGFIQITANGGSAPYTYSWSNGATTKDIYNLAPGLYSVVVTDNTGCIVFKNDIEVLNTIGINETLSGADSFILSPNPANDKFTIKASLGGSVSMLNKQGELVFSSETKKGINTFSSAKLANGTYTVQLKSAEKTKTFNLVVIH